MVKLYPADFEDDDVEDPDGTRAVFYQFITIAAGLMRDTTDHSQDTRKNQYSMTIAISKDVTAEIFEASLYLSREKLVKFIELANDYCNLTLFEAGARKGKTQGETILIRNEETDVYSQEQLLISQFAVSHIKKILIAAKTLEDE